MAVFLERTTLVRQAVFQRKKTIRRSEQKIDRPMEQRPSSVAPKTSHCLWNDNALACVARVGKQTNVRRLCNGMTKTRIKRLKYSRESALLDIKSTELSDAVILDRELHLATDPSTRRPTNLMDFAVQTSFT